MISELIEDPSHGEVRMKQISASPMGNGTNALFGLGDNGIVYEYIGNGTMARWVALRMNTKFGDLPK